jgi:ADP-ribose pyrophosphatase
MAEQPLIEEKVSSEEVFKGGLLHAFRDNVRLADGTMAGREYVVHPGAVMIVPLLTDAAGQLQVVLERQFRYPIGRVMIEFPAGKLDPGEGTQRCAQRELQEETGYRAAEWARAGLLHPLVSYSTEFIEIWFARGLTPGAQKLDHGELLEVFSVSPPQLLQWCCDGQVTDGKTLAAALWLQNVLSGRWHLSWQAPLAGHIAG